MEAVYIIAEAAQGYEGSRDLAKLLVRAAAAGGADAVKFQVVFADDLCTPAYQHAKLFRDLEMPLQDWAVVGAEAERLGIDLVVDVFGARSLAVACELPIAGLKLHSTTFFDDSLTKAVLDSEPRRLFISTGGIEVADVQAFIQRHGLKGRANVTLLFGYQAEPTPVDCNNLRRIPALAEATGLPVGFMDHSDGGGPDTLTLSAMGLALGVRTFEKHIGLDGALKLEDYVSALAPSDFSSYAKNLRRLASALGSLDLSVTEEEKGYRLRALKRVVAAVPLEEGMVLVREHLTLLRPERQCGLFRPEDAIGCRLLRSVEQYEPIEASLLSKDHDKSRQC